MDTAQGDTHIFPAHGAGDGLRDRGFADARRAGQADNLPFDLGRERTDRQQFEDSLLDFLKPVMVFVEDLFRLFQIEFVFAELVPRKAQAGFEVCAHDRILRRLRRKAFKPVALAQQFFLFLFAEARLLDFIAETLGVAFLVGAFLELVGDGFQLLPEIILALIAVNLLLHVFPYAVLEFKQTALFFKQDAQLFEPLEGIDHLEDALFVKRVKNDIARDIIGQFAGFFSGDDAQHQFRRQLRHQFRIFVERVFGLADKGLGILRFVGRNFRLPASAHGRPEEGAVFFQFQQTRAVQALDADAHVVAALQFEHLFDGNNHADREKVVFAGIFIDNILLRDEKHLLVVGHAGFEGGDRFAAPDFEMQAHIRENDQAAQGDHGHSDNKGFFHIH